MSDSINSSAIVDAMKRAAQALKANADIFTVLDQAVGDGDLGITMTKVGDGLLEYVQSTPISDIGKWLAGAGMAANRAAPSTMGTLLSTALMRSGKEVKEKTELSLDDLKAMYKAADIGIQERGKAQLGDKTIIDALHPASEAFSTALDQGKSLQEAGKMSLQASEAGRDLVTPLRNKVGRASWVGERTVGKVDPGCAVCVALIKALVE
ncbi:MAG: dihydroxyacetone kinase subunit L [Chloroflexota bacterium]